MNIKLDNIIVPDGFKKSKPKQEKLDARRKEYKATGKVGRIIIDDDNTLVDGYIAYLILKENSIDSTDIVYKESYKNKDTLYVFGHHLNRTKEFVWRVQPNKRANAFQNINVGDVVLVDAQNKVQPIIVTQMKLLSEPPVDRRIKKVVRWNLDK